MTKNIKKNDNAIKIAIMHELHKIEKKYKCELFLPPFKGTHNPSYLIEKNHIVNLNKMVKDIGAIGLKCTLTDINGKSYMEILGV